ncbi:heterogeneous nuclear ribonucleoprotein 1-like isoform X1 [Raphanus sativus]|uniref:Heterogeneous nuclear ribonucleoprotein 1-like isoform X1 n=1 Tax=Raphanus sativus TaxID=3726 RepID=A0A6J0M3E8_RAPSA|nr:heterogeneous nuclear ribonucleoprotein 1-like isoform X1 [Raphanus sativus]
MQSDSGKLFVGGISWDTNEERLKEYFSSFGEVIEAVILKDRTTGRARGFGFVVFADPAVAEIVITEKHSIDGRLVEAKKAVPRDDQNTVRSNSSSIQGSPGGPGARTRKIFVGGLPSSVTEGEFKTYFEQFGTPTDVVVMYDHNTQRPRGFGFITYDSEEAVDRVLLKTFHELNGKMVEVKRAVPKELSPSPARSSPLGAGYSSYGVNRVNNLLNGYAQGFSPGSVGGYGLRMDGRFSPVGAGRSGVANFGSGYGMNVNFEQGLPTGFNGGAGFNGNVDYGRGMMSPYYIGNTNRFGPGGGYEGGNGGGGGGGNSSFFSSVTRNLWGNNGGLNYNNNNGANSNSNTYMGGTASGNNALSGPFGNWGAAPGGGGGGNNGVGNENLKFGYGGNGESGFGLGTRNIGPSKAAPSSSFSSASGTNNTGYDGAGLAEFYGNGAVYSDPTWRSSAPETEGPGSFSYGIGGGGGGGPSSDLSARSSSPGYVGSYSVNKRQPNRGEPSL